MRATIQDNGQVLTSVEVNTLRELLELLDRHYIDVPYTQLEQDLEFDGVIYRMGDS